MKNISKQVSSFSQKKRQLLTQLLRERQEKTGNREEIPVVPRKKGHNTFPLSFSQERLWVLHQINEDSTSAYNLATVFKLDGPLNMSALYQAVQELTQRHEILRTVFRIIDNQPKQMILPKVEVSLNVVDFQRVPHTIRETEALRIAHQLKLQPFDLTRCPLFRIVVFRLDHDEYVMLLMIHHIISDGWSIGVMIRDLTELYQGIVSKKPASLTSLQLQYADFTLWQREWLQGKKLHVQLDYWRQQLHNAAVLELPTDRPRPEVQTSRGARLMLTVSPPLTEALHRLSRQKVVTLFMTLLAAFKTLLYRHTGQEDVAVGSPLAGRQRAELEGLIGFFNNTLVLRTELGGNPSFLELLGRVQKVALDGYTHQDVPFEKLLQELQPTRDLSRTPLFQVFINMTNTIPATISLPDLTITNIPSTKIGAKFDVTLYINERNERIYLSLVYNLDLFNPERMAELLEQFHLLLSQIVACPEKKLTQFSLVTPEAKRLLPDPTLPLEFCWQGALTTRFAKQAKQIHDQWAVIDPRETWTYGELETRSNQLAHYLLGHEIHSQDIVAVYAHRSSSLVWALLGILKAGAAFVILDPVYPTPHLCEYLHTTKPRGWLHVQAAGPLPDALQIEIESLNCCCKLGLPSRASAEEGSFLAEYPATAPSVTINPHDAAYVAFTSGSTGKPKGILGEHHSLSHFLRWYTQTFKFTGSDRFSMCSGLGYDPLLRDIFTPLCVGATLHIPEPEILLSPDRLGAWMRQEQLSVIHLTPGFGSVLTQAGTDSEGMLPDLRYIICGGDILTQYDVGAFRKMAPSAICVNVYGTTETPQVMGYYRVGEQKHSTSFSESSGKRRNIPLGRGIEGVQLLILNASQQLAGLGEVGQICVRTPYLARGYVDDETLTAERFVTNPYTQCPADRLYQTGDLGRYLSDGTIEFVGRIDQQVKIRSFRIELGEIKTVLCRHRKVQKAVIVPRQEPIGCKRLIAYVVTAAESEPTVTEMRQFLQERLPPHMIPSLFVKLRALPLTPNGKVDYHALPVPEVSRPDEILFVAPRTPTEATLAKVWTDVLGIQRIGIHDNFFVLGGDSLLLLRSIREARKAGLIFTPREFFRHQTIASLAGLEHSPPLQVDREIVTGPVPLTADYAEELSSDYFFDLNYHNMVTLFEVPKEITPELSIQIMRFLIRYHDGLRSRFVYAETGWQQFIDAPTDEVPFIFLDLSALPAAKQGAAIESAANELHRSFKLSEGLLIRIALFHLGADNPRRLLFIAHHGIVDAFSLQIFLQDARDAYLQCQRGESLQFPPKTTSLKQWAERLHEYTHSEEMQHRELDYWLRLPWDQVACLPVDFPEGLGGRMGTTNREILRALNREDTAILLGTVPKLYDADLMDIVVMALVEALGQWTGGKWVHFHVQDSGRRIIPGAEDLDLSHTVGNLLCRRHIVLERPHTVHPGEALQSIQTQLRRIPNRGVGYTLLRYCSGDNKIAEQMASLFAPEQDLFLNYLGRENEPPPNPAAELFRPAGESSGARNHPNNKINGLGLRCDVRVTGGCLKLKWSYNTKIHHPATMEQVVDFYFTALGDIVEYCRTQ